METKESVIGWALARHEQLDLKITNLTGIRQWLPEWSDFQAKIRLSGQEFIGRGTAKNIDLALTKALSEALERAVAFTAGFKDSNGIAAHPCPEKAKENAKLELFERDRFLSHFYTKTPFKALKDEVVFSTTEFSDAIVSLRESGIEVQFFEAAPVSGYFISGCVFFGEKYDPYPFGMVLGMGSSSDQAESLEKSFIEGLRNISWISAEKPKALSIEDFGQISFPNPESHRLLGLSLEYASQFKEAALLKNQTEFAHDQNLMREVEFSKISPIGLLSSAPLNFFACFSNEVQSTFWGQPRLENFNLTRLKLFSNKAEVFPSHLLPHPIG